MNKKVKKLKETVRALAVGEYHKKVRSKLTALFLSFDNRLFNHATCHTWAATAKWSWMIGVIITTSVDHNRVTANII